MSEFDSYKLTAIISCAFGFLVGAVFAVEWFLNRRKK